MVPLPVDTASKRSASTTAAPGDEIEQLRHRVRALTAQVAAMRSGRSRLALERAATTGASAEQERLRARAERAEAALAELRRDSARALLGLRREATFWRLVAGGMDRASAARESDLSGPIDDDGHDTDPRGTS